MLSSFNMFSSKAIKILPLLKQLRNLSGGLILDSKSVTKRKTPRVIDIKKVGKKKPRKKHVLVKKESDDIEAIWLENLNSENLTLFRKTSYGSYRKINLPKLLKRLQEIYPTKLGNVAAAPVIPEPEKYLTQNEPPFEEGTSTTETKTKSELDSDSDSESDSKNVKGLPYMSQYLITHIMEFPLFKTDYKSSFSSFVEQENEDFGAVDSLSFPSVTGILNETMSESSKRKLKQWRDRMIAEMGYAEFSNYYKDLLKQGSKFHTTLKSYLTLADKSLVKIEPEIEGCWKSLENFFPDLSDVRLVEEPVYHPILLYKGIVDCVASYRGTPCIIEWKKANKPKPTLSDTYDAPIQLTAYLGALPWNKNLDVKKGVVVVVYTDGTPANVLNMELESCEVYWLEWLRRVQSYWLKKSSLVVEK